MGGAICGACTHVNNNLKENAMKVAVTGASGFIGRNVLNALLEHHVGIVALTRNASRLSGLSKKISIVEMDISHSSPDCFHQLGKPDVLIHLAWDGLPNYKSLHHFETELPRQYQFLKAMVEVGLPSLLVTGTCFEYGMQSGPLSEDLIPMPQNSYGYAKNALRRQLEFLKTIKSFNLTWARLFYIYGEGQPKNSLYSQIKDAVLRKEQVFNMSGGEQLRDYLSVEEVARHLVQLAIRIKDISGTINICSGQPISVRGLVEQWLKKNNWNIELNLGYYPYLDYEPMAFWGTANKFKTFFKED